MRSLFFALFLTTCATPVFAQSSDSPTPVEVVAVSTEKAAPSVEVSEAPSVGVLIQDGAKVLVAANEISNARGSDSEDGMQLAIMGMLMALFKFLLSAVKFSSPFWKGRRGKIALRLTTIALGTSAGLISSAMDMGWVAAVTVGLSGPLAVAFHEYTVLVPSLYRKKDSARLES